MRACVKGGGVVQASGRRGRARTNTCTHKRSWSVEDTDDSVAESSTQPQLDARKVMNELSLWTRVRDLQRVHKRPVKLEFKFNLQMSSDSDRKLEPENERLSLSVCSPLQ